MTTTTEVSTMNKAKIIAELENMVAARLFSGQPWLANREIKERNKAFEGAV